MIFNTFELHQEGSLPGAHLVTYIQEYSEAMAINDRPLILLCPGGGYTRTSDREAEPMALKFLAMGYHAAVLRDVYKRQLMSCRDAREYLALEQSGETLNEYQQALLLDDYWMMRGLDYSEVILTEKDREYIRPYVEATLNSLADRYTFTAEEEKKFEDSLRNNYGYPRYEDCEEYIKKHNE